MESSPSKASAPPAPPCGPSSIWARPSSSTAIRQNWELLMAFMLKLTALWQKAALPQWLALFNARFWMAVATRSQN
jgi:hypothetical protein